MGNHTKKFIKYSAYALVIALGALVTFFGFNKADSTTLSKDAVKDFFTDFVEADTPTPPDDGDDGDGG
jgi:hypothetical protein